MTKINTHDPLVFEKAADTNAGVAGMTCNPRVIDSKSMLFFPVFKTMGWTTSTFHPLALPACTQQLETKAPSIGVM